LREKVIISHQTPLCELRTAGKPRLRMKLRPGKPTRTGKERRLEGEKVRRLEEQMAEDGGREGTEVGGHPSSPSATPGQGGREGKKLRRLEG